MSSFIYKLSIFSHFFEDVKEGKTDKQTNTALVPFLPSKIVLPAFHAPIDCISLFQLFQLIPPPPPNGLGLLTDLQICVTTQILTPMGTRAQMPLDVFQLKALHYLWGVGAPSPTHMLKVSLIQTEFIPNEKDVTTMASTIIAEFNYYCWIGNKPW